MMARTRVAGEAKEAVMANSDKKEDIGTRVFNAMTMKIGRASCRERV